MLSAQVGVCVKVTAFIHSESSMLFFVLFGYLYE